MLLYLITFINVLALINNYNNLLLVIINVELILINIAFLFIWNSLYLDDISGLFFSILIFSLAAAEAAILLSCYIKFNL